MKKLFRAVSAALLIIYTVLTLALTVSAATTVSGHINRDGVAYKLSEDKKSYVVVGYSEHLSAITILPDIDGIPVTVIKESAFHNNENINTVVIPATVKTIEKAAFRNCKNLTKVTFNGSIAALPEECFYDCSMLTTVNLPKGLESIGHESFKGCTMLGKVKIPSTVKEIGHDAFLNCERLLLDVSDNAYAAEYAKNENLNTEFENSTAYFLIIVAICVIVGIAAFILISIPVKKHIKKHPTHAPSIYIEKFFSYIGKFFYLVFGLIKKGILFVLDKLLMLIDFIKRKLNDIRLKKNEEKEAQSKDDSSN